MERSLTAFAAKRRTTQAPITASSTFAAIENGRNNIGTGASTRCSSTTAIAMKGHQRMP